IAGTKGKGSVSALCASALKVAGLKVGLYTSPHLLDYTERIRVNGQPISHEQLIELVEQIKPAVAKIPKLTTFEITTALGFLAFAQQKADAAVIEVGLGGRLDATNVITPKVSVITSLSYDHMAVLGNTLALIAGEKAGIIKPGVPVVSAPQKEEALEVLERVARERNAPFTLVGKDITYKALDHSLDGQTLQLAIGSWQLSTVSGQRSAVSNQLSTFQPSTLNLQLPLLGLHQVENAAIAYVALKARGLNISDAAIQKGFAEVKWPARFEVARREPPVIFDSAHNQDSFEKLTRTLEDYFPGRPVYLIFGASEDKNIPGMFAEIAPKLKLLLVTKANHPRALEPEKIQELARQAKVPNEAAVPVEAALARALEMSEKDGSIVLSAGSMFVTAEVMAAWNKRESEIGNRES
ncbi:MAG: bifunctional folylpolyglutamate synthase/dihydrofolate synthase, partial [Chloroflexi bacterium]|nr:bifunctional folylpolyglutamate synthase/dihydrofolate synthase [Chloroflexota bacterium]MBI3338715.1 bifunctional folylpolyglutamate synthase/dihydrofolate synthase [Chloroflexota bacterium]